jgi:D-alanyl-D-alanine endopeptidase (penicillin-binding protein 7)
MVGLWALCAAVLALRMVAGLLWIDRVSRQPISHPDHMRERELAQLARRFGITRAVRLRVIDALASPVTAGWWQPVVLVPAALIGGMPPELLQACSHTKWRTSGATITWSTCCKT